MTIYNPNTFFSASPYFPEDTAKVVFSYLDCESLKACLFVSTSWSKVADDNLLWQNLAKKEFKFIGNLNIQNIKATLLKLQSSKLKSNKEIFQRMESFLNRLENEQNGIFKCLLTRSNCTIELKIKHNRNYSKEDIKENFWSDINIGKGEINEVPVLKRAKNISNYLLDQELYFPDLPSDTATEFETKVGDLMNDKANRASRTDCITTIKILPILILGGGIGLYYNDSPVIKTVSIITMLAGWWFTGRNSYL